MLVDLAANGGNGAGSLLIRDLTDGESAFTAVPGVQNINLQLLTSPAPNPQQWDAMGVWIHSGFGGNGAVDNIAYSVPEPASLAVTIACAAPLLMRQRRQR
jgi:hypothetical protein